MKEVINDSSMVKVKRLFEKSGLSLHDLGLKMGYPAETARQSAWQFMKSGDPRISMLERFAKAMNVPLPELIGYGHDSRELATGEQVHIVMHPGTEKWRISSYDWSWLEGLILQNARVSAETLGWESKEFETADAAYAFVERQLKNGRAPSKANPLAKPTGQGKRQ